MKKKHEWITGTGQAAIVECELMTTKILDADGQKMITKCCDLRIAASLDGKNVSCTGPVGIDHPVAVAKMGILALTKKNYDAVMQMITKIKNTSEWQQKTETQKKIEKENKKYEGHMNMMRTVMAE